jgi:hypothetical protein
LIGFQTNVDLYGWRYKLASFSSYQVKSWPFPEADELTDKPASIESKAHFKMCIEVGAMFRMFPSSSLSP